MHGVEDRSIFVKNTQYVERLSKHFFNHSRYVIGNGSTTTAAFAMIRTGIHGEDSRSKNGVHICKIRLSNEKMTRVKFQSQGEVQVVELGRP